MQNAAFLPAGYDLLNPDVLANPYPLYERMRREDPIHFLEAGQFWVVTRYKDVLELFRDPRMSSDRRHLTRLMLKGLDIDILKDYLRISDNSMLLKDPPAHTELRKVANQGFMRGFTESWYTLTQQTVNELLDRVQHRGRFDLVNDFSRILPAEVIAGVFGVPKEERDSFQRWGEAIGNFFGGSVGDDIETVARKCNEASASLLDYFYSKIEERQKAPQQDVISLLIAAYEGGRFNRDELGSLCVLIMNAGFLTVQDMIPNAIYALLTHPEQWEKLKGNSHLVPSAVEECLRYDASLPVTFRIATDTIEIGDKTIPKGHVVALSMGSANRDPEQFESPEVFDITRFPNKHLSFAYGGHYCLGAPLARIELGIALKSLMRRMPGLRFDENNPPQVRCDSMMFKGYKSMIVKF